MTGAWVRDSISELRRALARHFRRRVTARSVYRSAATVKAPTARRRQRLRPITAVVARAGDWQRAFPAPHDGPRHDTSEPLHAPPRSFGLEESRARERRTGDKPKEEIVTVGEEDEALAFTAGEVAGAGRVETTLRGEPIFIRWDAALAAPRAYGVNGDERVVVRMFWFAVHRHYARVRTLADQAEVRELHPPQRAE
jgi:hypothetical protein